MIVVRTLEQTSFDKLFEAFNLAFADYDAPAISKDALSVMLERRGFSAKHSFGAFDGEKLVSFTFNGIGTHLGRKTAYDTGTGTIKEYRGQKLAGRVFEESIPHLREEGIEQYLLEVLQHNTPAFNIYKKQGFEISREFNYYIIETKDLKIIPREVPNEYSIKEITLTEQEKTSSFWSFEPSWQNSFASIDRRINDFKILGVCKANQLVGYGIIDPKSGDISQLAIDKNHRRKGLGILLMNKLVELNKFHLIKILNTEKGYIPMERFIESLNIPLTGYQYEMIKEL